MSDQVPAHIEPFVEILGCDTAMALFLAFGGTEIYLSLSPKRSRVLELTGADKMAMLAERLGAGHIRVPLAKAWIAKRLSGKGLSKAAIARELHVDQRTVGRWFAGETDSGQLALF